MGKIRPKVILVGPTSPMFKGGIVHYTYNLYQELLRQKFTVELISFSRPYPAHFFPGQSHNDLSKLQFNIKQEHRLIDWVNPFSWFKTAGIIKQLQPEIIIFQWWTWFWTLPFLVLILLTKQLTKSQVVIVAHNPFDHEQAYYKKFLSRLIFSQADKILAPNKLVQANLKALYPTESIIVAYHPIYNFFKQHNLTQQQAQKQLKLNSPLLLFFGHIRQYKGLAVLLKAMAILWDQGQKINLVIAGEFWENKQKYLKLISPQYQKHVQVVDRYLKNEEVEWYMNACDAVVIPYITGSGSGPSKVALTFNKPIVATDVADNPDLFSLGEVGVLVKPNNPSALSSGIIKVLKNKEKYVKNIDQVKPKLSWANLVKKITAN